MWRIVILMCLMSTGCGVEYPCVDPIRLAGTSELACYVDPPIVVNQDHIVEPKAGPPEVLLGIFSEQIFTEFEAGDDLPLGPGLQGGVWTHPAIRLVGIGSPARVECSLTVTSTGEVAGFVNAKSIFYLAPDGALEVHGMPIPVRADSAEPWRTLVTQPAVLRCEAEDDLDRAAELSVDVVIVEA